jgi:hypothetical protein
MQITIYAAPNCLNQITGADELGVAQCGVQVLLNPFDRNMVGPAAETVLIPGLPQPPRAEERLT